MNFKLGDLFMTRKEVQSDTKKDNVGNFQISLQVHSVLSIAAATEDISHKESLVFIVQS